MDVPLINENDLVALKVFTDLYPTWWYKIGMCSVSRDFDAAPQGDSPEIYFIEENIWGDNAFTCDHKGTLADAIHDVLEQISQAKLSAHLSRKS